MKDIKIKSAVVGDGIHVHNIQKVTWLATYVNDDLGITYDLIKKRFEGDNGELIQVKASRWNDTISLRGGSIILAYINEKPIGYVAPFYNEELQQQRLGALYILPEAQGRGIGRMLVKEAYKHLNTNKDIYLHVVSYNKKAIGFYEKLGFISTGKDVTEDMNPLEGGVYIPSIEMVLKPGGKHVC